MGSSKFRHFRSGALAVAVCAAAGAAAAAAEPKGGTKATVVAYEATHGAWTVNCDPCTSYEESVCAIWPDSDDVSLMIFPVDESDPKPPLAMTYYPRELAFETEGTLTVSVDGATARVIEPPDVIYTAMYGDLFIESEAVMALLPELREGEVMTLEFVDGDGGGQDDFSLDGFGPALDDMLAQLPFPRRPFDDSEPDSCPY